jgi:two-component system response regulator ResD
MPDRRSIAWLTWVLGLDEDWGVGMILVAEDEPSIAEIVGLYLTRAGYEVVIVADGSAALEVLAQREPELIVLDLMLPEVDGLEVTRWVRERGDTPIIMLTARGSESDRIAGLEMGADDYVVKPFSPQELVSRVRAVLRRTRQSGSEAVGEDQPGEGECLVFEGMEIDSSARTVTVRGRRCDLTPKEFDLLLVLAHHPRRVFTRDELLGLVWGFVDYIDPSTVTVHVRRLREKIEEDASCPRYVTTKWGVGYRFEP